jgi:hypothetical protein
MTERANGNFNIKTYYNIYFLLETMVILPPDTHINMNVYGELIL